LIVQIDGREADGDLPSAPAAARELLLEGQYSERGSTKRRTRSKRRSLATDMADVIFTNPLLAEGLNTLFAMFDG